jgi:aryl-alcohol dehydrogenase-like predicted oxidoreductase
MSLKNYVTLGRSGLRVSPFCLGAMTFGNEWGMGASAEESVSVIDAYIDAGGNFIDTANIYTRGHSEKILGDHLGRHPAKRDRLVIATKFMGNLFPDDPNGGGAHRKGIIAACEESLRRLQTDSIDLYWMHFHDAHTPIDETMQTLDTLVRQGKVRYIGFSDTPAWKCVQAQYESIFRSWTPLIALQIEHSLIERTVEGDLMPMARELGLGVTPWSPLKGGLLSGKVTRTSKPTDGRSAGPNAAKHHTERTFAIIDTLLVVSKECGCTPAQAALAWVQSRPGVTSTIIGARTVAQLQDNLGALAVKLSADQVARLDEVSKPTLSFPHEFLRNVASVVHGGITINGQTPAPWPLAPKTDAERF